VNSLARLVVGFALVLTVVSAAPTPAQAGSETLSRAISNIVFAPFDAVLSPVVAGKTLYHNLTNIDDTLGVQIAYTVPGFLWLTAVQGGAAVIRGCTGFIELIPGVVLLPFPGTEMSPLFSPVESADALVDLPNPVANVKFGINYTTPAS